MGCFVPEFALERKISPKFLVGLVFVLKFSLEIKINPGFFLYFVFSLHFHCQSDASTFAGIIFKFNFLDYQLQTNHRVNIWNRQKSWTWKTLNFWETMEGKVVQVPTQVKLQGQRCLPALAGNVWARGFPFAPGRCFLLTFTVC